MKKIIISIVFIIILLGCNRKLDNPLSTDEDLKNTPNILQINLNSDYNAAIILDYSYSDSSTLILERKSIGGFETVNYIKETQTTLLDTSFDKEINHTFIYRLYVKKDKYRTSYSEEKQLIYTSPGLNKPEHVLGISIELQGIQLVWKDKSNYEENYLVEKDGGSGFSALATLDADEETYFDAIPGAPQSPLQLRYRVKAVKSGLESEWVIISLSYAGIGSPTNLRITNSSPSNFRIDWQDNSNIETGYAIEKKKDSESYSEIAQVGVNETSYSDNISELGSYSYRIRAIKDGTYSIYSNEVTKTISSLIPSDGLVAYYPFNGNANDESENGNNGTVNEAELTMDRFGSSNSAYNFDGINDYININNNITLNLTNNFTISSWINLKSYPNGALDHKIIIEKGLSWAFGIADPDDRLYFAVNDGTWTEYFSTWTPDLNTIYHVVVVSTNSQSLKWYANGSEISSVNNVKTPIIRTNNLHIGHDPAATWNFYDGSIDDLRIYNEALNEGEIQALYHEGGWDE